MLQLIYPGSNLLCHFYQEKHLQPSLTFLLLSTVSQASSHLCLAVSPFEQITFHPLAALQMWILSSLIVMFNNDFSICLPFHEPPLGKEDLTLCVCIPLSAAKHVAHEFNWLFVPFIEFDHFIYLYVPARVRLCLLFFPWFLPLWEVEYAIFCTHFQLLLYLWMRLNFSEWQKTELISSIAHCCCQKCYLLKDNMKLFFSKTFLNKTTHLPWIYMEAQFLLLSWYITPSNSLGLQVLKWSLASAFLFLKDQMK